ncbi:InlB B-repeat-containing protein [Chitinispirillales bacterium ANBcel5]|uniref:InlB B-repeat-containing protein n=1 Tax=Cellulosispirillum alkaliphilum TaxID=3039283 RepID=UPI002A4E7759|nr:InlB B-repeat-containing protein [Chitinispirillales bacterium ANBcel5]
MKHLPFFFCLLIIIAISCSKPNDPIKRASLDLYLYDEERVIRAGEPFKVVMDLVGGNYIELITVVFGDSRDPKRIETRTETWDEDLLLTLTYDSPETYRLFITVDFIRNEQRTAEMTLNVFPPVYSTAYHCTSYSSGILPVDTNSYEAGQKVVVLGNSGELTKDGFEFLGWSVDGNSSSEIFNGGDTLVMTDENLNFYARWKQKDHTVYFESNGGSEVKAQSVKHGESAEEPDLPQREGYQFSGWFRDKSLTIPFDFQEISIQNDRTIYAKWSPRPNTVTFDANEGDGTMESKTVETGKTTVLSPNEFTRDGYTFINWNTEADGSGDSYEDNSEFVMGTTGIILYAQWSAKKHALSFYSNGGKGAIKVKIIASEQTVSLPSNQFTRDGYTFSGWNTEADGSGEFYEDKQEFVMGTKGTLLYAQWSAKDNTITFDPNEGTGSMELQVIATDQTASLFSNLFSREGYAFTGWNTEADGSGDSFEDEAEFTMGAADVTLYAQWEINSVTITFDSNGGSEVIAITQDFGTTVTPPDEPRREGYTFDGWKPELPETMPAENVTLTAQWDGSAMVLVFDTELSAGTRIALPLYGVVDVTVDWGDGSSETVSSAGNVSHTYDEEGLYTVSISGNLERFGYFAPTSNPIPGYEKLYKVTNFGDLEITSFYAAFNTARNLKSVPLYIPNSVTNMSYMFRVSSAFNSDIGVWDVSNVTDMSNMFDGASTFDQDIGDWDVSNVTDMSYMFRSSSVFNSDIGAWDVSNVNDMSYMFDRASTFDQNIGSWDVSNVTTMVWMFNNVTLSVENYDALLIGWANLAKEKGVQDTVRFTGGDSQYSSVAADARDYLINEFGWDITDAGLAD